MNKVVKNKVTKPVKKDKYQKKIKIDLSFNEILKAVATANKPTQ